MNLGIFGGTFNPIHTGHINASLKFYDEAKLDKLLIIPDRIPPHKQGYIASAHHRLNMLHAVYDDKTICSDRNIEISETELNREGKSYTIVTLRELKEQYPEAQLFLYTGSDMFYTLESWKNGTDILSMCTVYTAAREENESEKLRDYADKYKMLYGTRCIIGDFTPIVSSSTAIRDGIAAQNDKNSCYFTNNLLTERVNRYIMENGLYRRDENHAGNITEKVKSDLPQLVNSKRLSHILSVVDTAKMLADYFISLGFELDREKIILAAYLHDITKCMDQDSLCEKYGIKLSKDDIASMQTVHAVTGAYYAKDVYGVNEEIANAIMRHTVGSGNMTLTDKIIFVSDYCEETRQHEECISSRKRLLEMIKDPECKAHTSLRTLDHITAEILGKTIAYLRDKNCFIHGETLSSFKSILSLYKDDYGFRQLSEKYLR